MYNMEQTMHFLLLSEGQYWKSHSTATYCNIACYKLQVKEEALSFRIINLDSQDGVYFNLFE